MSYKFLKHHYPQTDGALLFGSSINSGNYNDIDLLILYHKFSYMSKETTSYNETQFNIIKIPTYDIFNLLATNFKEGIYKEIISSGIILQDEFKTLKMLKQYILGDYPASNEVIRYHFNIIIPEIIQTITIFSKSDQFLDEYLLFTKIINLLADYQLLKDGKTNFIENEKQKSRYLREYHPVFYQELKNLIIYYQHNSKEKIIAKINTIRKELIIPELIGFTTDIQADFITTERTLFFIKTYQNFEQIKPLMCLLYSAFPNDSFYCYYVDDNNIEKSGIYLICLKITDNLKIEKIKNSIQEHFISKIVHFPYNELFFHPEIKFHGKENLLVMESVFIEFQKKLFSKEYSVSETLIPELNYLIESLELDYKSSKDFYFYKNFNNSRQFNYTEIIKKSSDRYVEYEKSFELLFKNKEFINTQKNIYTLNSLSLDYLKGIPMYFLFQFLDRFLSLYFLKDKEKCFYIFCSDKIR